MKNLFIAGLLLMSYCPAYALLSPLNQSLEEIRAIAQDPRATNNIPEGQPITEIRRVPRGYLLITRERQMLVQVDYLPSSGPGPQRFQLIFHDPVVL